MEPAPQNNRTEDGTNSSTQKEEIKAVGVGIFGQIFDAFKGKAKEAVSYLFNKKEGEAKGVFHRDEIGEIGLVWGDEKSGLNHIIRKHIIEHSDYDSVEQLVSEIENVVADGDIIMQKGGNWRIELNGHRVVIAKSDSGNFIITAYDSTRPIAEKKRSDADATLFDQRVQDEMNGSLVSSGVTSVGKDSETVADKQDSENEELNDGIPTEIVRDSEETASEAEPSALSRVPVDEEGGAGFENPVYDGTAGVSPQQTDEPGGGEAAPAEGSQAADGGSARPVEGVPVEARPTSGEGELDRARRLAERHSEIEKHLGEKYALSSELANNGEVFYQNELGSTDLAAISDEIFDKIGIGPIPFKLTETMAWHVYTSHAKELGLKNLDDAIDFVLDIVNNVDHMCLGKGNTYIFSVENMRKGIAHRAITIVVKADNGDFLGIKTSGFDRMSNLEKRPILWESGAVSTPEAVATSTVTTIKAQQDDKHMGRAEGQSTGYGLKVNDSASDIQESDAEIYAQPADNKGAQPIQGGEAARAERLQVADGGSGRPVGSLSAEALLPNSERGREEDLQYSQRRQQGDLLQTESKGLDERSYVLNSEGNEDFGYIDAEKAEAIGIGREAPIKLQFGTDGFGLKHMEKHLAQLKSNGFSSVEEFAEDICRNYKEIRQGNLYTDPHTGDAKETYLLVKPLPTEQGSVDNHWG